MGSRKVRTVQKQTESGSKQRVEANREWSEQMTQNRPISSFVPLEGMSAKQWHAYWYYDIGDRYVKWRETWLQIRRKATKYIRAWSKKARVKKVTWTARETNNEKGVWERGNVETMTHANYDAGLAKKEAKKAGYKRWFQEQMRLKLRGERPSLTNVRTQNSTCIDLHRLVFNLYRLAFNPYRLVWTGT